ncbi:uncharacterized protein LOC114445029 [Parambassis ranga]|uniref:Uncharacterized protein LOC114445029 n=1 Tax=Parambassis ranga TaxID=210632 RepID=A0A6P7JG91_9TELE|nr:uncharacterized protein LOC114445029 [Parambassis ranga]
MKTFLLSLLLCHASSAGTFSLKYILTSTSGISDVPEFFAAALVNDAVVGYCGSDRRRIDSTPTWMVKLLENDPDHWDWLMGKCLTNQQDFSVIIGRLKQRFNQTDGAHVFQRMNGCEWHEETGNTDGFNQYGYDGEDFILFDLKTLTWIAPVRQAVFTKHEWDMDEIKNNFWKNAINYECVGILKKYVSYGRSYLQRTDPPSVSLLQKTPSSAVSCHATGFYPDRALMFWSKDGEEIHEGVEHGEILPNHDGTFQMSVDLNVSSVPEEDWRRYHCLFHLDGVEDIITELDEAVIRTNSIPPSEFPAGVVIGVVVGLLLLLLCMAALLLWKKNKNGFRAASTSEFSTSGRSHLSVTTFCVCVSFCLSVKHSLTYFITSSSGLQNFPRFVAVSNVDGVPVGYCDSINQTAEPRQDWVQKLVEKEPEHLEWHIQNCLGAIHVSQTDLDQLRQHFHHTEGVHVFQELSSCEWDNETDEVTGYWRSSYDGEDVVSVDSKTLTWQFTDKAAFFKQFWDVNKLRLNSFRIFIPSICPQWLKQYLKYGRKYLLRKDPPSVSLLQKTPSSAVSCHATGFYPDRALMFWSKDGEEIHEGVEHGEILPNHDGTFQMSVDLNVSSAEDWRRYHCEFQFEGAEDRIITELDRRRIKTNWKEKPDHVTIPVVSAVVVLVLVLVIVMATAGGYHIHQKRREAEVSMELSETSSSSNMN